MITSTLATSSAADFIYKFPDYGGATVTQLILAITVIPLIIFILLVPKFNGRKALIWSASVIGVAVVSITVYGLSTPSLEVQTKDATTAVNSYVGDKYEVEFIDENIFEIERKPAGKATTTHIVLKDIVFMKDLNSDKAFSGRVEIADNSRHIVEIKEVRILVKDGSAEKELPPK